MKFDIRLLMLFTALIASVLALFVMKYDHTIRVRNNYPIAIGQKVNISKGGTTLLAKSVKLTEINSDGIEVVVTVRVSAAEKLLLWVEDESKIEVRPAHW